jgi:hypothetical protein
MHRNGVGGFVFIGDDGCTVNNKRYKEEGKSCGLKTVNNWEKGKRGGSDGIKQLL